MPTPAILLFLKAPRAGEAKTRLTPFLTPEGAAEVAASLADDAARFAARCLPPEGKLVIVYAPDNGLPEIEDTIRRPAGSGTPPDRPLMLRQRGADLGERMANAVQEVSFEHDCSPLVLLGADCPGMHPEATATAFRLLQSDIREGDKSADVVLGPADDGGYYLLGVRGPDGITTLLGGVAWSTDRVFAQTVANAQRLRLWVCADLPVCYDIDTPEDLARLRRDTGNNPVLREQAPAITRWLQQNPQMEISALPGDGDGHP